MQNEFNRDEVKLISNELRDYRDDPPPDCEFNKAALQRICNAALLKLETITPDTVFNRQDYTIMCLAVKNFINALELAPDLQPSEELYNLCYRLFVKMGGN